MPFIGPSVSIKLMVATDPYGRAVFEFSINGIDQCFTKVVLNGIVHYASFPVERESRFKERDGVCYEIIKSLPRYFALLPDNGENSGVHVITYDEASHTYMLDQCVLRRRNCAQEE